MGQGQAGRELRGPCRGWSAPDPLTARRPWGHFLTKVLSAGSEGDPLAEGADGVSRRWKTLPSLLASRLCFPLVRSCLPPSSFLLFVFSPQPSLPLPYQSFLSLSSFPLPHPSSFTPGPFRKWHQGLSPRMAWTDMLPPSLGLKDLGPVASAGWSFLETASHPSPGCAPLGCRPAELRFKVTLHTQQRELQSSLDVIYDPGQQAFLTPQPSQVQTANSETRGHTGRPSEERPGM